MNILLTGCAGFIGSQVCELLLQQGHQVVGVDNLNDAYDVRLKDWRLAKLKNRKATGFRFNQLDICDRQAVEDVWQRSGPFDIVVNLAARAGVRQSIDNPWVYYQANVTGTLNLLEGCKDHGARKFLLASTSSLYAKGQRPFREDQPTDGPLSPYAASKKAAETLCYTYHHLYGIHIVIPRYFTVYGPAGRPDMSIFRFIKWIAEGQPLVLYGDGSQERDFTFVDNIASGTVAAMELTGHEIVNLGSDHPVSLRWVIHELEKQMGCKANVQHLPAHPSDVAATWADISKARRILRWEPRMSLEEGLERCVQWYRENRSWAKDVAL